jgi:hypothetical protein
MGIRHVRTIPQGCRKDERKKEMIAGWGDPPSLINEKPGDVAGLCHGPSCQDIARTGQFSVSPAGVLIMGVYFP